ncbi:hypothetical protein BV898_14400 [Hypsibius exemplaris]|uniref:SHSP domain-containing protein n=1 Tax=Hypsibius exemplaris TaxID=2072580 RepID=A0A9X6RJB1_HYPEX|nr:hypothetical protein BV898_14400 [Hypsibius exemplaris]
MFNRQVDPFGLGDILGDYDRQMRHMMRELNRMESQYSGQLDNTIQSHGPLTSLMDRSAIIPRIVDQNGQKIAQFNFDIKGFKPQDVHIKTTDGRLVVSAKHEDKGEDHHAIREFRRMVTLPEGMQIEGMKSRLDPNGVLSVYAPYTPPAIEHKQNELPIHHERDAKALK